MSSVFRARDWPTAFDGARRRSPGRIFCWGSRTGGHALILTTSADNLHKAHVRYIEARLVQLARAAGNAELDNGDDGRNSDLCPVHTAGRRSWARAS